MSGASVLAAVVLLAGAAAAAFSNPWPSPAALTAPQPPDPRFPALLQLFGNATTLSYVATHGSYFDPAKANRTVPQPGWRRAPPALEANPAFGMHALTFVNDAEGRVLVAFRGTDVNATGASGQADLCADYLLWHDHMSAPVRPAAFPPELSFCPTFNASTLDYLTAARALASRVQAAFPRHQLMYTGHSLGAGLAMLMAAAAANATCGPPTAAGAVVFSSPELYWAVSRRLSVGPATGLDLSRFAVLADWADPIYMAATASQFGGLLGRVCEWRDPKPLACELCNVTVEPPTLFCDACFAERHIFKHYVEMIRAGRMPVCGAALRQGCPAASLCPGEGSC